MNKEITASTAKQIHEQTLCLDAHADIATANTSPQFLSEGGISKVAPEKMLQGGLNSVVLALAVGPGSRSERGVGFAREDMQLQFDTVMALLNENPNFVLAKSAEDIEQAHRSDKLSFMLGFQNARVLDKDPSYLKHYYGLGARVFALTHMGHNHYADSSRPNYNMKLGEYEVDEEHGGLSPLGREAITLINQLGGVLDISQLSKSATRQALDMTALPVIASHSNVKSISDVRRNLSDEELDLIAENSGVVHISAFHGNLLNFSNPQLIKNIKTARIAAGLPETYDYPYELYWEIKDKDVKKRYLTTITELLGPTKVRHVVDHIDYIVERLGIDHVGIGTDFNHGSGSIDGYTDAADSFNITQELVDRGYDAAQISKIWSGNFLRVMKGCE